MYTTVSACIMRFILFLWYNIRSGDSLFKSIALSCIDVKCPLQQLKYSCVMMKRGSALSRTLLRHTQSVCCQLVFSLSHYTHLLLFPVINTGLESEVLSTSHTSCFVLLSIMYFIPISSPHFADSTHSFLPNTQSLTQHRSNISIAFANH